MTHRLIALFILLTAISVGGVHAEDWNLRSDLGCDARAAVTDRLANESTVTLQERKIGIRERFTIEWMRPGFPEREPIFLMVSFDRPVRLAGEGVYGLLPAAEGPFGIEWDSGRTRAIIPYFGRGMPKSGVIEVEPLVSGPVEVRWAVTGHSGCASLVQTPNQGTQVVVVTTSTRPEIVVNDAVSPDRPRAVLANLDGTRLLELHARRFRLLDADSGTEILEMVGTDPHFSPAGRYVVLPSGDQAGLFDSVDGHRVVPDNDGFVWNAEWNALIWSHDDSFVLQVLRGGGLSYFRNLVAGGAMAATNNGCRICGSEQNSYRLDLANNVLISESYNEVTAIRLSSGAKVSEFRPEITSGTRTDDRARVSVLREVDQAQAVASLRLGTGLAYSDEITLTDASLKTLAASGNAEIGSLLQPFTVASLRHEPVAATADVGGILTGGALAWRAVDFGAGDRSGRRIVTRLRDFGVPVIEGARVERIDVAAKLPPRFDYSVQYPTNADRQRAEDAHERRISETFAAFWEEIAKATGVDAGRFERRSYLGSCSADGPDKLLGEFETLWRWSSQGVEHRLTTFTCAQGSAAFLSPTTYLFSANLPGGIVERPKSWGVETALDLSHPVSSIATQCTYSVDACSFEVKAFGNWAILHSQAALGYAILDLESGKVVQKQFDLPRGDLFDNVLMTDDGRHLVTVQDDGSFFVNRLSDARPVLSGRYADDEIVVWTEDGRFDATSEGAWFVSYRFPGHQGQYTAQQFESYLKVPGLAAQVLAGVYEPEDIAITPPPVLRASIQVVGGQAIIEAEASGAVPLAALSVFQDGLRTDSLAAEAVLKKWSGSVTLLPGTRWVSLVATDENGVASAPYSIQIAMPDAAKRVHVVSVGINDYDDPALDLTAAVGDARLFAKAVTERAGNGLVIATDTLLLDGAATPEAILSRLDKVLADARPGDTLAFYFAGHGLNLDGRYFLAAAGADVQDIAGTALPFDTLADRLRDSDLRIVLFIDSCHSGVAGEGLFSTNDDVVDGALDRIPSGLVVFAAAKGREFSLEDPSTAKGFFAEALADVLSGPEYDLNRNGALELSEMFRGTKVLVSERVLQAQAGVAPDQVLTQTPWMARNLMVGDFSLF